MPTSDNGSLPRGCTSSPRHDACSQVSWLPREPSLPSEEFPPHNPSRSLVTIHSRLMLASAQLAEQQCASDGQVNPAPSRSRRTGSLSCLQQARGNGFCLAWADVDERVRSGLRLSFPIVFRRAAQPGYISRTKSQSTHTRRGSSVVFLPRPMVRNIPSDFIAWAVPSKTCWQETTPPAIQSSVLLLA